MKTTVSLVLFACAALSAFAATPRVEFTASTDKVACYDFVEIRLDVAGSAAQNPFTDVTIAGTFGLPGETPLPVDGFCDSADGRLFRIRFMPPKPGAYDFTIIYREAGFAATHRGSFEAVDGRKRGLVRPDPEFSGHFIWEASHERVFVNSVAVRDLISDDEPAIRETLDRLDHFKVTRIHTALSGTPPAECGAGCVRSSAPTSPWPVRTEATSGNGCFDLARFDPAHWQKWDRLLAHARSKEMIIAILLAPAGADPFASAGSGNADEERFVRYLAARFAAYANIAWDAPDISSAPRRIAQQSVLQQRDPYRHLVLTTPVKAQGGATPAETPARALLEAWEACLTGSYPILNLSEPGGSSDHADPAALELGGHLYDFFTGISWWELRPDAQLVVSHQPHPAAKNKVLAPGRTFAARNAEGDLAAVYVAGGGIVTLNDELLKDQLKPLWFSPRDGGMRNARALRGRVYRTPTAEDWVLLFRTPCNCSFRDFDNEFE